MFLTARLYRSRYNVGSALLVVNTCLGLFRDSRQLTGGCDKPMGTAADLRNNVVQVLNRVIDRTRKLAQFVCAVALQSRGQIAADSVLRGLQSLLQQNHDLTAEDPGNQSSNTRTNKVTPARIATISTLLLARVSSVICNSLI